ncbi:MAG: hypothetical protein ACOX51_05700 [Myxococcota bacterium]|jgi:hypothetical protein|nr:hypothetical protein [Myxococcota bacterium]MBP8971093.1 hypothetical protein [Myxococcota bacterium]HHW96398.1 hypothetical protein [Oligoflexales bacterium]HQL56032.1 hypothetical protein [Myxococcota bacterium]
MSSPPKLGQDIEIYCRYCKLNLDGVVAALTPDGSLQKVQCRTCKHFQDFKPPVDMEAKRAKLVAKALKIAERHTAAVLAKSQPKDTENTDQGLSPEAVLLSMWHEATKDAHPLKTKIYDQHRMYKVDDLISHKAFGLGKVQETTEDSMVVLFRHGFENLDIGVDKEEF